MKVEMVKKERLLNSRNKYVSLFPQSYIQGRAHKFNLSVYTLESVSKGDYKRVAYNLREDKKKQKKKRDKEKEPMYN